MVQTRGQQLGEHGTPQKRLAQSSQRECGLTAGDVLKTNTNTVVKQNLKLTGSEIVTNTDIRTRSPSSDPTQLASDTLVGAHCHREPVGIGQGVQLTKCERR